MLIVVPEGEDWIDKKPIKTYPEYLEIKVRKMVSNYIEGDAEELIIEILELIENQKK